MVKDDGISDESTVTGSGFLNQEKAKDLNIGGGVLLSM
jgi:hypothetical protein